MTFRPQHLIAALVLHALLFGLLVSGVQCSRLPTKPPVIRAVLLDPSRQEVRQQKREEEQRRLAEQRRAEEAAQKRKELEARRKIEAEQKQREEAEKQKAVAEKKKAEEQARRKREEEERRDRDEALQREVQERARMEEELRRETIQREVQREQAARAATEREARLAQWVDALERHVQKNWVRPTMSDAAFECTVRVQLLPDGTVTAARIVKSCGNPPLDKSVEDAVFRSSPLPRPGDPAIFDRDLIITFRPK